MLEIRSKEARQILIYFLFNPRKELYSKEIADALSLDASNTNKALNKIYKEGLISREKRGGHWFYCLNEDCPMLQEYKKIILFKYGLPDFLKKEIEKIKDLKEAYIYGSYAKECLEAESDIDILLIGNHSIEASINLSLKLQKYFGREFNITDMKNSELKKRKKQGDDFIKEIFKSKHIKIL